MRHLLFRCFFRLIQLTSLYFLLFSKNLSNKGLIKEGENNIIKEKLVIAR